MAICLLNKNGPFESRRIKLAALRQGHQIVPSNWIDDLIELDVHWIGVRWANLKSFESIASTNSSDVVVYQQTSQPSNVHCLGIPHPGIDDCEMVAEIVFVCDRPA